MRINPSGAQPVGFSILWQRLTFSLGVQLGEADLCGLQKHFYLKTQFRELMLHLVGESQSHIQNYLLQAVIIQAAFCQFGVFKDSIMLSHMFKRINTKEPSPCEYQVGLKYQQSPVLTSCFGERKTHTWRLSLKSCLLSLTAFLQLFSQSITLASPLQLFVGTLKVCDICFRNVEYSPLPFGFPL